MVASMAAHNFVAVMVNSLGITLIQAASARTLVAWLTGSPLVSPFFTFVSPFFSFWSDLLPSDCAFFRAARALSSLVKVVLRSRQPSFCYENKQKTRQKTTQPEWTPKVSCGYAIYVNGLSGPSPIRFFSVVVGEVLMSLW